MKHILLVEDDDDTREVTALILRDAGYEVSEAENGQVALERLEDFRDTPCLVLLDVMMPVMSGPQLLGVLERSHRLAALPVVMVSAVGAPTDAPGAKKFVRKPLDRDVLLRVVEEFCGDPES